MAETLAEERARARRVARRRFALRAALALLAAALAAFLVIEGFRDATGLRSLESGINDSLRVNLSPYSETQDPRISVLTITEDTLQLFPYRSPVDRDFLADLIDTLGDAGVRAIALDILIDQPTEPAKDDRLIQAIRDFDGALILAYADARAGLRPHQQAYLDEFTLASGAIPGSATVEYDPDGVVRHFASTFPGMEALSMPAAMLEAVGETPDPSHGLIDWRRETADHAPAFQKIPSHAILNPNMPRAMFKNWFGGRFVFIGADLEQTDRHLTSLVADPTTQYPTAAGVLVHAHVLSQMLDHRRVRDWRVELPQGQAVVSVAALLGAVAGILAIGFGWRALLFLALLAGYGGVTLYLAAAGGPYLPASPGIFVLAISFGLAVAAEAILSGREKRFIRQAFSHYLEPAMVERLSRDPESLKLGGERREISFIFTDVAGFTDMTEQLEPEVLSGLLNVYFDGMSDIIGKHGGLIDKFIGDAVVALFGALTRDADHALRALQCAAEMDAFAEDYRRQVAHLGLGVTRIGVHTGVASVGNFGGRKRFDYTAMGDAMNTAARLESINKALGTRATVSAVAREHALAHAKPGDPALAALRPVGRVRLKGKAEPVAVWSLAPPMSPANAAAYAEAFSRLDHDPEGALSAFVALARAETADGSGPDPLAALHLSRLRAGLRGDVID